MAFLLDWSKEGGCVIEICILRSESLLQRNKEFLSGLDGLVLREVV